MKDAINRQDAIDAFDKRFDSIPMEQTTEILLLRKDLRDLPTAEPKRIRGKWIYGEDSIADGVDGYRCDRCGFFVPWDYTHKSIDYINSYNYCPYCGADMRGGHDDQKTHDKRTETHACDLTDRQAAIDFIDAGHLVNPNEPRWSDNEVVNFLKSRPSAQPDLSEYSDKLWRNAYERGKRDAQPEIIRCKDCKWKQGAECVRFADVRPFPDDYCSRAERREDG